ncbi:MAG: hypothetical protein ACK5ST_01090 [bacterium]|jgi:hypothetical protein
MALRSGYFGAVSLGDDATGVGIWSMGNIDRLWDGGLLKFGRRAIPGG